ncbi:hypothetical protein [Deinococcus cavernae]|uniref:hypothetical protein n=1 Tax=Deinococcus cavernae TaxID=2320857 RepID=UPI0011C241D4|nr:hypothetical protein [Deinococcus cavernae]
MSNSALSQVPETEQLQRRWLPTNRYNLMAIQAGRLIRPQPGYGKYYADVLDLRPGYVPLLPEPPGLDVLDYCGRETPQAWPVLLELHLPQAMAAQPALAGMVPSSSITAVHCRSREELEEIRQHQYENTADNRLPFMASPELFTSEGMTLDDVRAMLHPLPEPPEQLGQAMNILDRLTGGLLAVASHGEREQRFAQFLLTPAERRRDIALSADELGLLASTLLGNTGGNRESALLHTAIHVILSSGEADLVPAALIDRLMNEYERLHGDDQKGSGVLKRLQKIVADPTGTPPKPASGWPVAAGLLLLLLYRNMKRLTGPAPIEALNPSHGDLNVARFLAGLARGRQRLESHYRNPALDELAAAAEAAALAGQPGWMADWLEDLTPEERQPEENPAGLEAPEAAHSPEPQAETYPEVIAELPAPYEVETAEQTLAVTSAAELAVPQLEQSVQTSSLSSWLDQEALEKYQIPAAVWLCESRGWVDLIRTEVRFKGTVQIESPQKGIVVACGQGVPEISTQVDVRQLRRRLTEVPLTAEETSSLEHMLAGEKRLQNPDAPGQLEQERENEPQLRH